MFESSVPLASAPMTGTVCSVDLVARTCSVSVGSSVVDGVTWSGPDPIQDQSVYLTDMGDRMVIVSALDSEMHWVPYTQPEQEWRAGDVTRDGPWLMVATNDTADRPSPTLIGTAGWYTSTTPTQTTVSAIMVTCGNRYTAAQAGVVDGWRVYVDADQIVTAWLIRDPDGAATRYELGRQAFYAAGWQAFSLATPLLIQAGEMFDLVVLIERIMMRTMAVNDSWDYSRVNEISPAPAGQILHSRWLPDLMSISKMDANSVDHSTALEAVTFGYRVEIGGTEYMVLEATDEGDSMLLQVNPSTFKKDGQYVLKVGPTSAGSTRYRLTASGWPAIPSGGDLDGRGFYSTTGGYSDAILNLTDTRFGVDVHWQAADVSPDWDVLALAAAPVGTYVRTAGDTMSGNLIVQATAPEVRLDIPSATPNTRGLRFLQNSVNRWLAYVDSVAETGSDIGSQFRLRRYDDAGAAFATKTDVILISRADGVVQMPAGADITPKAGAVRILTRSTTSITNATATPMTGGWTVATGDGGNVAPLSYSSGVITVGEAGYYDVTIYMTWTSNSAGLRRIELLVNGSAAYGDDRSIPSGGRHTLSINSLYCAAGDTLQVSVYQSSGGALNINDGKWNTRKVADA